jgi:hypothetical protein
VAEVNSTITFVVTHCDKRLIHVIESYPQSLCSIWPKQYHRGKVTTFKTESGSYNPACSGYLELLSSYDICRLLDIRVSSHRIRKVASCKSGDDADQGYSC